jgi:hypothetical protein
MPSAAPSTGTNSVGLEELLCPSKRFGQAVRFDEDRCAVRARLDPQDELALLEPGEAEELAAIQNSATPCSASSGVTTWTWMSCCARIDWFGRRCR